MCICSFELAADPPHSLPHPTLPPLRPAAKAAAEAQRQAAEAAQGEARVLRERCSQQRAALSQQQDKENQWKVGEGRGTGRSGGPLDMVWGLERGRGLERCLNLLPCLLKSQAANLRLSAFSWSLSCMPAGRAQVHYTAGLHVFS